MGFFVKNFAGFDGIPELISLNGTKDFRVTGNQTFTRSIEVSADGTEEVSLDITGYQGAFLPLKDNQIGSVKIYPASNPFDILGSNGFPFTPLVTVSTNSNSQITKNIVYPNGSIFLMPFIPDGYGNSKISIINAFESEDVFPSTTVRFNLLFQMNDLF